MADPWSHHAGKRHLYVVPEGLRWPAEVAPGVDIIQTRHRYIVAAPSVHPNGGVYVWRDADGNVCDIPRVDELPELPEAWITGLTRGEYANEYARGSEHDVAEFQARIRHGKQCPEIGSARERAVARLALADGSSRHDVALRAVMRLHHLAAEGHIGLADALGELRPVWLATLDSSRSPQQAASEWERMVRGAAAIAAANRVPSDIDPCQLAQQLARDSLSASALSETSPAPRNAQGAAGDVPGAPVELRRRLVLTPASEIVPEQVDWLWDGRLPVGELAILVGRPGEGKSVLSLWVAARVTRGELPGTSHGTPRSVLVITGEESWAHTVAPRLIAAGADIDRVTRVDGHLNTAGELRDVDLTEDLRLLGDVVHELDTALVIVDPLSSTLGRTLDTHNEKQVRGVLAPVGRFAQEHGVCVLGLMHHNKTAKGSDPLAAVNGSVAFGGVARIVHTVLTLPEQDESDALNRPGMSGDSDRWEGWSHGTQQQAVPG